VIPTAFLPRRLQVAIGFVVALGAIGVVGFTVEGHESVIDALLTTVSAISTVGYSPPRPLDTGGKALALLLIVGGLVGIALVISALTEYFMEGQLQGAWERRKMDKAILEMQDHFIISGFGRVGQEVAKQLAQASTQFVVLDINPATLSIARDCGYVYVEEDASHDSILRQVGIERARGLLACADSDMNNVYVTLTARYLNSSLYIVARAAHEDAVAKLRAAGADRVISPYVMAGRHMAQVAVDPLVAEHLDLLFDGTRIGVSIQELPISEESPLSGRTIKDLHRAELGGAYVVALDRDGHRMHHVEPELVVLPGDQLLVVGSGDYVRKLSTIS